MKSKLAKARDKWLASVEGKKCSLGQAHGQYLINRLIRAFFAGADFSDERIKELKEQLKEEYSRGVKDGLNQAAEIVKNC